MAYVLICKTYFAQTIVKIYFCSKTPAFFIESKLSFLNAYLK
jgi:hypothetical protein